MPTGTRIIKGTVDRIVADGRDRIYWDGDLEGFGLRVRPSGHKAYVVRFRAGGRTHRVTLGVIRRRRLTPWNRRESTCYHADRRPICTLNNTSARVQPTPELA